MGDNSSNYPDSPPPGPVLDYRTPVRAGQVYRPPRKPLPTAFCVGFGSASVVIAIVWAILETNLVHHAATRIVTTVGLIGVALCIMKETRLAGLSVLLAAGAWYVMIACCLGIGMIPTRVF